MRRGSISPGEIVIEIATPRNSSLFFRPFEATLRGRWEPANNRLAWDDDSPFRALQTVPGMYVAIDLKARMLRAVDPLSFAENAAVLANVQSCQKDAGPADEIRLERLQDTELKTALFRIWEAVDSKHANLVQGELPAKEKILGMPGELIVRSGTERCYDPKFSLDQPLPPFAVEHELRAMGAPLAKASA